MCSKLVRDASGASTPCPVAPAWRPVLVVRARGAAAPIRVVMGLGLCSGCKAKVRLADLLTDGVWAHVSDGLERAGARAPDRELTALDFCALTSRESRALDAARPS